MGIRTIDFIETQAQGRRISTEEGGDTPCMLAGLGQCLDIRETSQGLRCVEFQRLKSTRSRCRKHQGRLPNSWRTVKKDHRRMWACLQIGSELSFDICMPDDLV